MPGLTPNTTYYVRAYATNGVGTGYGNQVSFATIDATVSAVTNSATAGICTNSCLTEITVVSTASNTCNAPIDSRGIRWSENSNMSGGGSQPNGSGVGSYTTLTTNDLVCNRLYYVQAYVLRPGNVFVYGNIISLTTLTTEPSMSVSVTQTKYCEATVSITNIINGCNDTATYSVTMAGYTVGNGGTITGLLPNTLYYWSGQITNSLTTVYYTGNITTMSLVLPDVVVAHSEITSTSVKLTLTIPNSPNPAVVSTSITINGVGTVTSTGPFSHTFTGLTPSTSYNYSGRATNSCNYQVFGGNLGFTTLAAPVCTNPTVTTLSTSFLIGGTWNGRLDNVGTPNPSSDIIYLGFEYSYNNFITIAGFLLAAEGPVSDYSNITPVSFFQTNPNIQTRPLYVRAVAIRGNCKGVGLANAILNL